jgi:alkylated DNA repair dioxygenase AlkB
MIKNVFKPEYADKLFEMLKNIRYNTDDESMIKIYGLNINIPRRQCAFGEPNTIYKFSGISVKAYDWTKTDTSHQSTVGRELYKVCKEAENIAFAKFNYVLVNNYLDQSNSIGYHSDDERELGSFPCIVGISLGQQRTMHFKSKLNGEIKKFQLLHNSMFIMYHPTNAFWQHAIPKETKPMGQRISLTFRSINNKEIKK